MDLQDEALLNLWKSLADCNTEYIMIGGFAVNMNGFSRFTHDADILIHDTLVNRQSFRKALVLCGIGDFPEIETMDIIPGFTTILLDGGIDLDIFSVLPGFETTEFSTLLNQSSNTKIDGIPVQFLHLNQLIETKKVTNRPKDLIDIAALEEIKKLTNDSIS